MPPKGAPKRNYRWQSRYEIDFGLQVASVDERTKAVDSAVCLFCRTFGREADARVRKRQKTKAIQTFTKDRFNPGNMQKHMKDQHLLKWKKYLEVKNAREEDPDAFKAFFEQTKLEAFFFKKSEADGAMSYSIDKAIVEDVVRDMLFNEDDQMAGDIAMRAFKEVTNEEGDIISYTVRIKNRRQFDHVLELLAASLSFRQIAKVIRSDRENLGAAAKIDTISPGEAANYARLAAAIGLQALSEIMKQSWTFSIGADESNDELGDPHLDSRIRFPPVVGYANYEPCRG